MDIANFAKMIPVRKSKLENGSAAPVPKTYPINELAKLNHPGKMNLIVDDIIDTGGSLIAATNILKEYGARNIYVCVSHGIFSHNAITRIEDSMIKEVVVTNTITIPQEELKQSTKIKTLSIGWMLSKLILAVSCHTPVSEVYSLYEDK